MDVWVTDDSHRGVAAASIAKTYWQLIIIWP